MFFDLFSMASLFLSFINYYDSLLNGTHFKMK